MLRVKKPLFAPYSPRFQTVTCNVRTALGKTQVSVLYLSSPEEDSTVESTLATLGIARPEWAFNWPHLRQLLKARNIRKGFSFAASPIATWIQSTFSAGRLSAGYIWIRFREWMLLK